MTRNISLFDPTARVREDAACVERALSGLGGKVVGFIDNAKPNFNHLVDDLAELFVARYGVSRVLKRQKRSPAVPAPQEYYTELAEQCDLVITGSGD